MVQCLLDEFYATDKRGEVMLILDFLVKLNIKEEYHFQEVIVYEALHHKFVNNFNAFMIRMTRKMDYRNQKWM